MDGKEGRIYRDSSWYINDLPSNVLDLVYCYLFGEDAKVCKDIQNDSDKEQLQQAFYIICAWTERWLLKLNLNKCNIVSVKRSESISYNYFVKENIRQSYLCRCELMKDLGVTVDSKLSFEDHIIEKVNKVYSTLGLIKRNYEHVGKEAFLTIQINGKKPSGLFTLSLVSI